MRSIFTLLILTVFFLSSASQDTVNIKIQGLKVLNDLLATTNQSTTIRIRCLGTISSSEPLFVIDGIPVDGFALKNLNPTDIESISILKNSQGSALFGCRAVNGIVIITTKTANERKIIIKDILTGEPIPAASVDLINIGARDTTHFVADSNGTVMTKRIIYGNEYELKVSNIGYKSFITPVNSKIVGKNYFVLLEKSYSDLMPVVVIGYPTIRCRTVSCRLNFQKISAKDLIQEDTSIKMVKFYPNPVFRSQKVNIEFKRQKAGKLMIKLMSIDGKLISSDQYASVEGMNRINYGINSQVSPGVYIVQICNENNYVLKTQKLDIR